MREQSKTSYCDTNSAVGVQQQRNGRIGAVMESFFLGEDDLIWTCKSRNEPFTQEELPQKKRLLAGISKVWG